MRVTRFLAASIIFLTCLSAQALDGKFPSTSDKVPAGWTGPVFQLSQSYPKQLDSIDRMPWKSVDFVQKPQQYVEQVYRYVLEGNVDVNWVVQKNKVRKWYHAPWMHYGDSGREFIHGMTRERTTPAPSSVGKGELGPDQVSCAQNWAVGFFNSPGGYQVGKVWSNPVKPDATQSQFPEGTVIAKLLFTSAPVAEVPYLKNSLEWTANVNVLPAGTCPGGPLQRQPQTMRLLQMDLAVKDARATETGWVFATMTYNGNATGTSVWDRMEPVGVMWGNEVTSQQWINKSIGTPQHLGYEGRLNGPVDNPRSSCISCHATAQTPANSPMIAPIGDTTRWFKNYLGSQPFDSGSVPTDYSLQIAMGIQNMNKASSVPAKAVRNIGLPELQLFNKAFDSGREIPSQIRVKGILEYPIGR